MTTEKALREALTRIKMFAVAGRESAHGQCKNLVGDFWAIADQAEAALSLPETQGEPVAGDVEWLHKFINCTPFGADAPAEDMQRAHRIVDSLYAAPPSQPAQGEAATEKLQKLDAIIQETRDFLDMVEMLSEEPDLDRSDTLRLLGVLNDYRAMLAAAPAAPTQAGAFKIGDTVTKVTGDYHLNAAPQAVLPPETKPDKTGRDAGDQQEAQPASAAPSAIATPKPTNGEGA